MTASSIWRLLGIAPTADPVVIKRAYARALKTTRPDDNPEGYQALREAFELALHWSQQCEDVPEPTGPPVEAHVPHVEINTLPSGDEHAVTAIGQDWTEPYELAHALHRHWRTEGDPALINAWPWLQQELDRLPLSRRAEASNWFANLVLECPALPVHFVSPLARYFQWGKDYRADALLGEERAQALSRQLRDMGALRVIDSSVLKRFADILHLQRLMETGAEWRTLLFAGLSTPKNPQRLQNAPPGLLRGLGLDPSAVTALSNLLMASIMVRLAILAFLVTVVISLDGKPLRIAIGIGLLTAACMPVIQAAFNLLRRGIDQLHARTVGKNDPHLPGKQRCGLAVGLPLLMALLSAIPAIAALTPLPYAMIACAITAIVLVWSPDIEWRGVLPVILLALTIALENLFRNWLPAPLSAAIAVATLWTLLAHWLFLARSESMLAIYRSPVQTFRPRTALGWVYTLVFVKGLAALIALAVLLAVPLTYIIQAVRLGTHFTVGVIMLALGAGVLFDRFDHPWIPCLLITPIFITLLHTLARRFALSRWIRGTDGP